MKDTFGESYEDLVKLIKMRADDFQEFLISTEPVTLRSGNEDRSGVGCAILFVGGQKQIFGHQVGNLVFQDGILNRLQIPMAILPPSEFVNRINAHRRDAD